MAVMAKINKAKINYIIDVIIGIGFLASAITGIVLLLNGSGGYQGGRNPRFVSEVFIISRSAWNSLHTWSSVIMVIGVFAHLVLHWKWIVNMTKRLFKHSERKLRPCPIGT